MQCQLAFRPYQRQLKHPLQTHHGTWEVREGIIVRLSQDGETVAFGEIAPLPWFGSETWQRAWDFCQQLPTLLTAETIAAIPAELPACQFGLGAAWSTLCQQAPWFTNSHLDLPCCGLLPAGDRALLIWQALWEQGYRSFKWKIGVAAITEELHWLEQLKTALPATAQLRLDANGGLTKTQAQDWLKECDRLGIEFLEQPLPPDQFADMRALSEQYWTPIALDESVATLAQLRTCYQQGWQGIFVVKAAIAGSPMQLWEFCQTHAVKLVFSSVLETAIGRQTALQLAATLNHPDLAVGFGVQHWFDADNFDQPNFEQLWNSL